MPRLTRSTSLTFAPVFGFLSVLTIFGVSSGSLKAEPTIGFVFDTTVDSLKEFPTIAHDGYTRIQPGASELVLVQHRAVRADPIFLCRAHCKSDNDDCNKIAVRAGGQGKHQCPKQLNVCLKSCRR